jgi:hypothetical protein
MMRLFGRARVGFGNIQRKRLNRKRNYRATPTIFAWSAACRAIAEDLSRLRGSRESGSLAHPFAARMLIMRNRGLMTKLAAAQLMAAALTFVPAGEALAGNLISNAVEQAKPCSRLKVTKFGVSVGLDQFKSADIQTLHVDIDGNEAKIALSGSLSCKSSESAIISGDAYAEVRADLALDLSACQFTHDSIRIISTGGAFGLAIEAAKGEIERALERSLVSAAKSLCK